MSPASAAVCPQTCSCSVPPQEVADQTKKMLDLCAPGGGFIMTNSLALDQVKRENMDAWKETLFTYGQY